MSSPAVANGFASGVTVSSANNVFHYRLDYDHVGGQYNAFWRQNIATSWNLATDPSNGFRDTWNYLNKVTGSQGSTPTNQRIGIFAKSSGSNKMYYQ